MFSTLLWKCHLLRLSQLLRTRHWLAELFVVNTSLTCVFRWMSSHSVTQEFSGATFRVFGSNFAWGSNYGGYPHKTMVEEKPVCRQTTSLDPGECLGWIVVIACPFSIASTWQSSLVSDVNVMQQNCGVLPGLQVNEDDVVEKWVITNVNVCCTDSEAG